MEKLLNRSKDFKLPQIPLLEPLKNLNATYLWWRQQMCWSSVAVPQALPQR
jgi:hypothetical protein